MLVMGFPKSSFVEQSYRQKKYKLPHELIGFKLQKACELKAYFDNKCGRSIYEILGINDAKL